VPQSELAVARRRKRQDLLAATERRSSPHNKRKRHRTREPLRGQAEIALKVGAVINKYKMAKHFTAHITRWRSLLCTQADEIDDEGGLDGILCDPHQPPVKLSMTAPVCEPTKASLRLNAPSAA